MEASACSMCLPTLRCRPAVGVIPTCSMPGDWKYVRTCASGMQTVPLIPKLLGVWKADLTNGPAFSKNNRFKFRSLKIGIINRVHCLGTPTTRARFLCAGGVAVLCGKETEPRSASSLACGLVMIWECWSVEIASAAEANAKFPQSTVADVLQVADVVISCHCDSSDLAPGPHAQEALEQIPSPPRRVATRPAKLYSALTSRGRG